MNEPWRNLQPGDQVRIVRMPYWSLLPDYTLPEETIALYRLLVEERAILTIDNIDEYGKPWTHWFYVIETSGGGHQILPLTDDTEEGACEEYHALAMDDNSWEHVERVEAE
jgi:hypothetical protein